jgi:hypothetical protein
VKVSSLEREILTSLWNLEQDYERPVLWVQLRRGSGVPSEPLYQTVRTLLGKGLIASTQNGYSIRPEGERFVRRAPTTKQKIRYMPQERSGWLAMNNPCPSCGC